MTLFEFAIARHYAQLAAELERRELTEKELGRLEVLERCVAAYEAREMEPAPAKRDRRAAAQRKHVVDDSRREPRPADQMQV